jgi:hypothetical protein
MDRIRVSELLQEQIRKQKDGLEESLRLLDDTLSPDASQSLENDLSEFSLQGKIREQKNGLRESLLLLDDSMSPDGLKSQENDPFPANYSTTFSDSGVIDFDRPPGDFRTPLHNTDASVENSVSSSDSSIIDLDRLSNRFHLNISRCIAFQALNETNDGSDEASMKFTHMNIRDLASERAPFAPCDSESTYYSNEQTMMDFHKEILLGEFRNLLRNHPQGGEMTVDAHKLRILLDLMHQHSSRLEARLHSFYGMRYYEGSFRPTDCDGTISSSATDTSEPFSMSSLYSRAK